MPGKSEAERPDVSQNTPYPGTSDMQPEVPVFSSERNYYAAPGVADSASGDLIKLYDSALAEYNAQREKLADADKLMKSAKNDYSLLSQQLSECSSALSEVQSKVSTLEKDISSLNSSLSKAQSSLSKLRSRRTKRSSPQNLNTIPVSQRDRMPCQYTTQRLMR